jgi:hypothetical protein
MLASIRRVISSADATRGAMPLVHARFTVVKVNGDYGGDSHAHFRIAGHPGVEE